MKRILSEKGRKTGLLSFEWVMIVYAFLTSIFILFAWQKLDDPSALLLKRFVPVVITLMLGIIGKKYEFKLIGILRILFQLYMLVWWYPDTYELNKAIPNLDHIFASAEQWIFGCQPALTFCTSYPQPFISEAMSFGYFIYYPLIVYTAFYYFVKRKEEIEKVMFIIMGSFFAYYLIFDFLPVVGPTFYYKAVGLERIAEGVFPAMGDYFTTHTDCMTTPGYTDGVFYQLVEGAKAAGERPTAAFPSSHVGIATICMLLLYKLKNKTSFLLFIIPYILLSMATVYIQAHYVIDAIAGLITGILFYYLFIKWSKSTFILSPEF